MVQQYKKGDQIVADHWLLRKLGRGSFGEVWRARTGAGLLKAIKIVDLTKPGASKEESALRIMMQVHHPNICGIDNFWFKDRHGKVLRRYGPTADELESTIAPTKSAEDKPSPNSKTLTIAEHSPAGDSAEFDEDDKVELIIAMQLCEASLKDVLLSQEKDKGGLPRDKVLRYLGEAARAIDYVNARHGIQHRDIKPENLLVLADIVLVGDFGLAKDILRSSAQTQLALTPHYAAPEQSRGEVAATTDQYALAITYVHLLTGHLPYRSDSRTEVDLYQLKVKGDLQLDDLSEHDRAIIRKATSPDPKNRYASCTEMVEALRARQPTPSGFPWPLRTWSRLIALTVVCVLLAVVIFNFSTISATAVSAWHSFTHRESPGLPTEDNIESLRSGLQKRASLLPVVQDVDDWLQKHGSGNGVAIDRQLSELRASLAVRVARWLEQPDAESTRNDVLAVGAFNRNRESSKAPPGPVAWWRAHLTALELAMNPTEESDRNVLPMRMERATKDDGASDDDLLWSLMILGTDGHATVPLTQAPATPTLPDLYHLATWKQALLMRDDTAVTGALSALRSVKPSPWTVSEAGQRSVSHLLIRQADSTLRRCDARPWKDTNPETRRCIRDLLTGTGQIAPESTQRFLRALRDFTASSGEALYNARYAIPWKFAGTPYLDGWDYARSPGVRITDLAGLCRWRTGLQISADQAYLQFLAHAVRQLCQTPGSSPIEQPDLNDVDRVVEELTDDNLDWDAETTTDLLGRLSSRFPTNLPLLARYFSLLDPALQDQMDRWDKTGKDIGSLESGHPLGALLRGKAAVLRAQQAMSQPTKEVERLLNEAAAELEAARKDTDEVNLRGQCATCLSSVLLHKARLGGITWSDYDTLFEAAKVAKKSTYPDRPFELDIAFGNALEDLGRCFLSRNESSEVRTDPGRNREVAEARFSAAMVAFQDARSKITDDRLKYANQVAPADINCARIRIRQLEIASPPPSDALKIVAELEAALIRARGQAVEESWRTKADNWLERLDKYRAQLTGQNAND